MTQMKGLRPRALIVLALCLLVACPAALAASKSQGGGSGGGTSATHSSSGGGGSGPGQTPAGKHQDDVRHGVGTSTTSAIGGEGVELAGFLLLGLAAIVLLIVIPSQLAKGLAARRRREAPTRPRLVEVPRERPTRVPRGRS